MTKKLLTVLAISLFVSVPAFSHEDDKGSKKEHVHCDPKKDKNCKDEHDHSKDAKGDKHDHKEGDKHDHKESEKGKN